MTMTQLEEAAPSPFPRGVGAVGSPGVRMKKTRAGYVFEDRPEQIERMKMRGDNQARLLSLPSHLDRRADVATEPYSVSSHPVSGCAASNATINAGR